MRQMTIHAPLRLHRPGSILRAALRWLVAADDAHRQRVAMDRLDAHLRRDIGLTDIDESATVWNAPIVLQHR